MVSNDYPDAEIVAISASEDRVLLTRDVGVLKHGIVMRGYFLRETQPARQLVELLRDFDLGTAAAPFTRCLRCNSQLHVVAKDRVQHLLSRADARMLTRILSMSDLQPYLLAGVALLAHEALHRSGFRGGDAPQPTLVSRLRRSLAFCKFERRSRHHQLPNPGLELAQSEQLSQ